MVNKERVLTEFFELVRITCRTKAEREVADVLKAKIASYGWEVTVSEDEVGQKIGGNCGNVYLFVKGNLPAAPALLLSAHLDCVEPSAGVEPVLKDGVITSAGNTILGGDDKAGVVAIMEAIRVIHEQNLPHGDIQVVFTVAEEGGVNGSKNMDPSRLKADFGFALDSSGIPGKLLLKHPVRTKLMSSYMVKPRTRGWRRKKELTPL